MDQFMWGVELYMENQKIIPNALLFRKQWIETKGKAPIRKGWTEPENWKWYTEIRGDRSFVLGKTFLVLDFDHVLDSSGDWVLGEAEQIYRELVFRFPTWVEYSSSGTGLHCWYRVDEVRESNWTRLDWDKEKRIGLDIFFGGSRHVVVSGKTFRNDKIRKYEELEDFLARFNSRDVTSRRRETKVFVNSRTRKAAQQVLNRIDCSSLSYEDWLQVSSCCKQLGMHDAWDEWCRTDPERFDERENRRTWDRCRPIAEFPVSYLRFFVGTRCSKKKNSMFS